MHADGPSGHKVRGLYGEFRGVAWQSPATGIGAARSPSASLCIAQYVQGPRAPRRSRTLFPQIPPQARSAPGTPSRSCLPAGLRPRFHPALCSSEHQPGMVRIGPNSNISARAASRLASGAPSRAKEARRVSVMRAGRVAAVTALLIGLVTGPVFSGVCWGNTPSHWTEAIRLADFRVSGIPSDRLHSPLPTKPRFALRSHEVEKPYRRIEPEVGSTFSYQCALSVGQIDGEVDWKAVGAPGRDDPFRPRYARFGVVWIGRQNRGDFPTHPEIDRRCAGIAVVSDRRLVDCEGLRKPSVNPNWRHVSVSGRIGSSAEDWQLQGYHGAGVQVSSFDRPFLVSYSLARRTPQFVGVNPHSARYDDQQTSEDGAGSGKPNGPPIFRRFLLMCLSLCIGLGISVWGWSNLYDQRYVWGAALLIAAFLVSAGGMGLWATIVFPSTWGWPI